MQPRLIKSLVKVWLAHQKCPVQPAEFLTKLLERSPRLQAARAIGKIATVRDYKIVSLSRHPQAPFHIPGCMPWVELLDVVYEITFPQNWHYYETPNTRVMPNDIVADCGASEGLFGLSVLQRCRKLYLFEPLPEFVEALKMTFRGAQKVKIVPVALSDHSGTGRINECSIGSHLCDGAKGKKVMLLTLDNFFHSKGLRVSYIKADVEGGELALLRGGRRTIAKYRPRMAIAVYHRKGGAAAAANLIRSIDHSYKIHLSGMHLDTGEPVILHAWI